MTLTFQAFDHTKPAGVPQDFWDKAVQYGEQYHADPLLLTAIAKHETNFGQLGAGQKGYVLGYGYTDTGGIFGDTTTLDQQLSGVARKVAGFFGSQPITPNGIQAFENFSWKASDKSWPVSVSKYYEQLKAGGLSSPAPSSTPQGKPSEQSSLLHPFAGTIFDTTNWNMYFVSGLWALIGFGVLFLGLYLAFRPQVEAAMNKVGEVAAHVA